MKSRTVPPSGLSSVELFERDFVRPKPGRTLIVGSQVYRGKEDRRLRYEDVVGVDMLFGPGVDRVLDLEYPLPPDLEQAFDHVECMSVLEHSRRPWLLAANIERLMAPGASLFVTVPFCWRIHAYPSDYWRMTPQAIRELFPLVRWDALKLANETLSDGPRIPGVDVRGHVYMSKTETVGFGWMPGRAP